VKRQEERLEQGGLEALKAPPASSVSSFSLSPSTLFCVSAAIITGLLAVSYAGAFRELYRTWTAADSYYSHGFLIPPICLYFVWQKRAELRAATLEPTLAGFALLVPACLLLLAGDSLGLRLLGQFSLLPMIAGLILVFFGRRHLALLWFPLVFLLFMIPIPPSITQSLSLRIKLLATDSAVRLARLFTLPMVRDGSFVHFGNDQLLVGEVCGGLRSFIALIAFGALMSYMSKARLWARLVILLVAGPVAIASNMLRIFALCVVAYFLGSQFATGRVHDVSGILIFVVAFILLFSFEALLRRIAPQVRREEERKRGGEEERKRGREEGRKRGGEEEGVEENAETSRRPPLAPRSLCLSSSSLSSSSLSSSSLSSSSLSSSFAVAATIVLLAVTLSLHAAISHTRAEAARAQPDPNLLDIPSTIGPYKQVGADIDPGDRVREILQTNAIVTRQYVSPGGWPVELMIVHTGQTRGSLHFPEVCLVGQGWEVREQYSAPVGFLFTAKRLVIFRGDRSQAVLYWFKTGSQLTGNYFLNTLNWVLGKITFGEPSSSMIRLSTVIGRQGDEVSFRVLEDFALQFEPILLEKVR
jgi:EpsI family protein